MGPFFERHRHFLLLLLYPLVGLGFAFCEVVVVEPVYVMEWPGVDELIPFVPWMVWPYFFWYLLIFATFAWLGWRDREGFTRFSWFIYGGMTSAFVIYLLFPNGQQLRPAWDALGIGWDYDLLRWLYRQDTPNNCNPSIHVIDTMAVWFALHRDRTVKNRRWAQVLVAGVSVLIIASTVLVKQHSILDLFGGLIWSALWYIIVYSRWSLVFRFRKP